MNAVSAPLILAIRGPIMLILVGVLFLLSQRDVYQFRDTWPILIIAYGVLKLLERSFAPKTVGR